MRIRGQFIPKKQIMQVLGRRPCVKELYGCSKSKVQRDNAYLVNFISFKKAKKNNKNICVGTNTHTKVVVVVFSSSWNPSVKEYRTSSLASDSLTQVSLA